MRTSSDMPVSESFGTCSSRTTVALNDTLIFDKTTAFNIQPTANRYISQLLNLFIGTPRICNFILLLIVWVRSFSKMLPSVKFAKGKVLVFVILHEKCQNSATLNLTLISRAD